MNLIGARLADLTQLRAALAVQATRSVTEAADRIGLTQPAVSRLVSMLEADLGFALFNREKRRLSPSQQGEIYLREAEMAFGALLRLQELGRELRRGRSGLLRIAAVSALAHGLAPRVLAALQQQIADLTVEVSELDRAHQIDALRLRQLDVGLVALPMGAPGVRVDVIAQGHAVCLLPEGHPLAHVPYLDPETIGDSPFVRLRDPRLLEQMVDDAFANVGRSRRIAIAADSTHMMLSFVADGLGLAITHSLAALAAPPGVVTRPFRPALAFEFAALTRTGEKHSPAVAATIALTREIAIGALGELEGSDPRTEPAQGTLARYGGWTEG
jgi:DNA-binding transcriptional LysR family regulator